VESFAPRSHGAPKSKDDLTTRRLGSHERSFFPALAKRIRNEREKGATLREIAERLNEEGVPTARGGKKWRPSSLEAVLRSPPPA
jgi:hypothetical protein